jgi:CRP-like cAMP-binding protein
LGTVEAVRFVPLPDLSTLLAAHPLFATLTAEERTAVGARMAARRYPRGATIFFEGEPTHGLLLVGGGVVRVVKRSPGGREQTLRFIDPGQIFAEAPLFDGGTYPASAEAFTDVLLYTLPVADFRVLLRTVPQLAETALAMLAARNRHLTDLVENLAFRPVIGRVARALLDEPREQTQMQMAATVGAAREMVNRSLHLLEREGVIRMASGHITILDRERLAEITDDM